jgi:hypothetical protein
MRGTEGKSPPGRCSSGLGGTSVHEQFDEVSARILKAGRRQRGIVVPGDSFSYHLPRGHVGGGPEETET